MDAIKLKNTIDSLCVVVNVPEDKKKELINKYSTLSENEVIKELSQIVYRVLGNNEEIYSYCLGVIRNINPDICPSVEEMKIRLSKMFSNEVEGNMSLEENHQFVNESIVKFTKLFNQYGIDYYIVGALPCFLKTGQPLFRYHDDIDIMINEDDIPKVAEIVELCGYEFHDDRFPDLERFQQMEQNKPPHTVLAQNPNNEFHLGFFAFRREQDDSITMREYSHRLENGEVVVDVLERQSDPIGTILRYDEKPTEYMGTTFRTSTIENVYILKEYTRRPKDITDMEKIEPYVDKQKIEQLKQHPNHNVEIQNVECEKKRSSLIC
jgi:hypothetical protein